MLSGDNGILQKSTTAKENIDSAQIKERIQLAYHSALVGGHGSYTKESLENELEKEFGDNNYNVDDSDSDNWILTVEDQNVTIPAGIQNSDGTVLDSPRASITPAPTGATYVDGTEVTFGGEKFFVIGDDGTTVKLLAKYCLSTTANEQVDKNATNNGTNSTIMYGRTFSSTNYWSSDFTKAPFDLQGTYLENNPLSTNETEVNNAIKKAQAYGETKGVTGRLMTYDEAYAIQNGSDTEMKNILWGKWTIASDPPTEGYLRWCLGAAYNRDNFVYFVHGASNKLSYNGFNVQREGVRPVLVIQ